MWFLIDLKEFSTLYPKYFELIFLGGVIYYPAPLPAKGF